MDPQKLYSEFGLDQRLQCTTCIYCGREADTTDHIPSRILLDDPLPDHLARVPACSSCNRGFSSDEEYLAGLLECVLSGTTEVDKLMREKVRKSLQHSPGLRTRLRASMTLDEFGNKIWNPEMGRVENVIVKTARGHVFHELSEVPDGAPEAIQIRPIPLMSNSDLQIFEDGAFISLWPELGSRAMLRCLGEWDDHPTMGKWVVVQPDRYRYSIHPTGTVSVVLSEYLACSVQW